MDDRITLSYVLTTYNKLPYLRVTIPYLLAACQPDEEIVVVDGGSQDGSAEYLAELHKSGKIHQFITEKDFGEAHGTNKAMLLAKGKLIKIITDDDVYFFSGIQECKSFLQLHPDIDVLGFDGFGVNLTAPSLSFSATTFITGFNDWRKNGKPFLFCGLSLMIRKSALARLGLFNTQFKIVDMEYSMRVSSMNAKIAFYTGMGFVNIVGPDSNSIRMYKALRAERKKVRRMYQPNEPEELFGEKVRSLREMLGQVTKGSAKATTLPISRDFSEIVLRSVEMLKNYASEHAAQFLTQ